MNVIGKSLDKCNQLNTIEQILWFWLKMESSSLLPD